MIDVKNLIEKYKSEIKEIEKNVYFDNPEDYDRDKAIIETLNKVIEDLEKI